MGCNELVHLADGVDQREWDRVTGSGATVGRDVRFLQLVERLD